MREATRENEDGAGSTIAAIDIGTNSMHLVVARHGEEGRLDILCREKEVVRLGSGSTDMKHLQSAAIERGVRTLERFRRVAERFGAEIRAVATSAVREAANRDEFLDRAREEAGVPVDVISGFEEARLIYLGVLQSLPVFDKQVLLIDIGGGSTEFLIGRTAKVLFGNSLKLGAIRLTERFFRDDPIEESALRDCRRFVRAAIHPIAREADALGHELAIGCSGTITNLAQIARAARGDDPTEGANSLSFTRSEMRDTIKLLLSAESRRKRTRIPGLDPKRADIIIAGALILEGAFEELGIEKMVVSAYALREGVLLDSFHRLSRKGVVRSLSDIRYRGVLHVAQTYEYEKAHVEHVARLSLSMYDQLAPHHELDDSHREYLHAAALLHNVGLFVSHARHHHHSYYLIKNSEHLVGFTYREVEMIAQVSRYHRKSLPKRKHLDFLRLRRKDQRAVRHLAGILRIAVALNHTHASAIDSVRCEHRRDRLLLHLHPRSGKEASVEVFTAQARKTLLAKALGVPVELTLENDQPLAE